MPNSLKIRPLILSKKLLIVARHLILASRKDKIKLVLEQLDLDRIVYRETFDCLMKMNNSKKEMMSLYWLRKGTIRLPEDLYKVDKAFEIIDKRHLDFQKYDSPTEIIGKEDNQIRNKYISPDSVNEFYNKKILSDGVTVYYVTDDKEGQEAVRSIVDSHWSTSFNNWCIIYREDGKLKESSWRYWDSLYNKYPKRIAFKNGKLVALCANSDVKISWWDKNDNYTEYIPVSPRIEDDQDFIDKYIFGKGNLEEDPKRMNKHDVSLFFRSEKYSDKEKEKVYEELKLLGKTSIGLKMELAKNINTSENLLRKLYKDENRNVRWYVAKHPNTPVDILKELCNDQDSEVRKNLLSNKNITEEILRILSNDYVFSIKKEIAKNPKADSETLMNLCQGEDNIIKTVVLERKILPKEILEFLSKDKNTYVRSKVVRRPDVTEEILRELFRDRDETVRASIAKQKNTPVDILIELSKDENEEVRYNVANNEKTPVDVLIELSKDEDRHVRSAIAHNIKTPESILRNLAVDNFARVREGVAWNPNTTLDLLRILSRDEDDEVKEVVASNPKVSSDILREMSNDKSNDKSNFVREKIAENPKTPVDVLIELSKDENYYVRKKAKQRLR